MGRLQLTFAVTTVADRLLVIAAATMALGLGATLASRAPLPVDRGGVSSPQSPTVIDRGVVVGSGSSHDHLVQPATSVVAPATLPAVGAASRRSSPLQTPTGATATEVGRVTVGVTARNRAGQGLPQDSRTFLMQAAIFIHAPSSAPVTWRRSPPPHPHGVD